MIKTVMLLTAASLLVAGRAGADEPPPLTQGWIAESNGRALESYETGVDRKTAHGGKASAVMRGKGDKPSPETLYLTQSIKADDFRGKRVRFSGFAKTDGDAHLRFWFQAWDDKYQFGDTMRNRPITGTTGWTRYEIVIDIPADAGRLKFGTAFLGKGAAWVDDFKLEVVDLSVPTTAAPPPRQPVNLDFES